MYLQRKWKSLRISEVRCFERMDDIAEGENMFSELTRGGIIYAQECRESS